MDKVSDTPRTDASYVCHYGDGLGQWVPREFACELERELAAAQADAERYRRLRAWRYELSAGLNFPDSETKWIDENDLDAAIDAAMKEMK